nr:MAG TPA: hypothetical protein [Bacteriophage sp.]
MYKIFCSHARSLAAPNQPIPAKTSPIPIN